MGGVNIDTLYEILSAERRREALSVLAGADEPLSQTELARQIAIRRGPSVSGGSGDAAVNKVDISLGHVHLPKLESGGVVERTADDRYVATSLGRDLERAARAFEEELSADGDPDAAERRLDDSGPVTAKDSESDAR